MMQDVIAESLRSLRLADPNTEQVSPLQAKEEELKLALDARDWEEIRRLEEEIAELKRYGIEQALDRERVMSDTEKLRYQWLKYADPRKVPATRDMIEILDKVRAELEKLPDGSKEPERIRQGMLIMAQNQGCTEKELIRFNELLLGVIDSEKRAREKKRRK